MACPARFYVAVFLSVVAVIVFVPIYVHAEVECPPGSRLLTESDVSAGGGSKDKIGTSCINAAAEAIGINADVGAAKKYLQSLTSDLRDSCAPPTNPQNIQRLDNGFAICAAAFFQAYQQQYGQIKIVSAYRSPANTCNKNPGTSNHGRGVAIDVNPAGGGSSYETLWAFARNNPQLGVCFPFENVPFTGHPNGDRPHMVLAGIGGSEGKRCAAKGLTQACRDGAAFVFTGPFQGEDIIGDLDSAASYDSPDIIPGGTSPGGGASGNWLQQITRPLLDYFRQQQMQQQRQQHIPPQSMAPQMPTPPPPPQIGDSFTPPGSSQTACTQEAMLCPDGSAVGRTGPNCEFAPCPTITPPGQKPIPQTPDDILTHITITAPPASTTATTTPLTQEEYDRLYGQQTVVVPPQPQTVVTYIDTAVVPNSAPYAGFVMPQYTSGEEPLRTFLQSYVTTLTNIARTMRNILHRLRGEPLEVVY